MQNSSTEVFAAIHALVVVGKKLPLLIPLFLKQSLQVYCLHSLAK